MKYLLKRRLRGEDPAIPSQPTTLLTTNDEEQRSNDHSLSVNTPLAIFPISTSSPAPLNEETHSSSKKQRKSASLKLSDTLTLHFPDNIAHQPTPETIMAVATVRAAHTAITAYSSNFSEVDKHLIAHTETRSGKTWQRATIIPNGLHIDGYNTEKALIAEIAAKEFFQAERKIKSLPSSNSHKEGTSLTNSQEQLITSNQWSKTLLYDGIVRLIVAPNAEMLKKAERVKPFIEAGLTAVHHYKEERRKPHRLDTSQTCSLPAFPGFSVEGNNAAELNSIQKATTIYQLKESARTRVSTIDR